MLAAPIVLPVGCVRDDEEAVAYRRARVKVRFRTMAGSVDETSSWESESVFPCVFYPLIESIGRSSAVV